jgi:pSer/pThr/pTyr-binding forkhead associated (FHA) protein
LSSNGILINGRRTPDHDLEHGDKVTFDPSVTAQYYRLTRETGKSGPLDPLDVTLIDPAMIDETEE